MKIIYCYLTILMLTFNVNAKVITVNNASDNNNGNCELDCSLRDAIMTAKQYDKIYFADDYNIDLENELIIINKNFTIDAGSKNITVNGQNKVRVFQIKNSTITINNLSIINGKTTNNGGGFLITNSSFVLNNSILSGNTATNGGGIFSSATSNTTINNSVMSNNAAFTGENIYSNNGILQIIDTFIAIGSKNIYGTITFLNQINGINTDFQIIHDKNFINSKSRSVRDSHSSPLFDPEPLREEEPIAEIDPEPLREEEPIDEVDPEPLREEEPIDEVDPEPLREEEPIAEINPEPLREEEPIDEVDPEPLREEEPIDEVDPEPLREEEPIAEIDPEPLREEEPIDEVDPEPLREEEPIDEVDPEPLREEEPIGKIDPELDNPHPPKDGNIPETSDLPVDGLLVFLGSGEFEFEDYNDLEEFEISIDEIADFDIEKLADIDEKSFNKILPEHLKNMPSEALVAMSPEQRTNISKDAMAGLTKEHLDNLPKEILDDLFKADKLAGLSPDLIYELDVENLNINEVKQMSDEDASWFFYNLDNKKISNDEIKSMLPDNWSIDDETGDIEPPPGAKLFMQTISQEFTANDVGQGFIPNGKVGPGECCAIQKIVMPKVPNLGTGRGVGGTGTTMIEYIQNSLSDNINLSQDNTTGILNIEEKDETGDVKNRFAFLPDNNSIMQVDKNTVKSELSIDQGCFYKITTSKGQQMKVIPTVKDPDDLSKVIDNSQIIFGEYGDIFMELPATKTRNSSNSQIFVIADPFIEPTPDDWCLTDDTTGEQICDFGVTISSTRDKHKIAKVIYSDGTSQKLMPTVFKPDILIKKGLLFPGVEDIIFNKNGTFTVLYKGEKYLLVPSFDVQTRNVPTGKTTKSKLNFNINSGGLIYTIGVDLPTADSTTKQISVMFNLSIEPVVEELCKVNY